MMIVLGMIPGIKKAPFIYTSSGFYVQGYPDKMEAREDAKEMSVSFY
jgi:hypothetical protein